MAHRFTSIGYPIERLEECEHFLGRMAKADHAEFKFELNAFLSASRSVTFVLQKAQARAPGFDEWYSTQKEVMKQDAAMVFFLELRNVSQKEGPVSYVGGGTLGGGATYRFLSTRTKVPEELVQRDIGDCCAGHLQKLAALVLKYCREFPFNACVASALTPEGMAALGFTFRDVEALLGLPPGYTDVGGSKFSIADKLRILRSEVDSVDVPTLERLASGQFEAYGRPILFPRGTGHELLDDVARVIDCEPETRSNPRVAFLKAIFGRVNDVG